MNRVGPLRRGWRALPRALRWLLIGLPAAAVTFMLAINVALWSGVVDRLVSGKHRMATIELEVGSAWMLWPGTVHVRDFRLDIDAYRYQLHVELPEGEAEIALLDLFSRAFHTRWISGDGASVVLLLKMAPDRVDHDRLERFPAIADFEAPVREASLPDIPPLDEAWTVHLEGIDVDLTHLTVDEAIFAMAKGHLQGSLYTVSGHAFAVDGARVDVEDASLRLGDDECVGNAELELQLDIAEYDPFEVLGRDVVGQITATVRAHANVRRASPFEIYLPDAAGNLALGGGEGPLHVEAGLDGGVLMVGSELTYDADALRLFAGKAVVGAPVHLRAAVDTDEHGPRSTAELRMDGLHGGVAGEDGDVVTARTVRAMVAFGQSDVTADEWPLRDLRVWVPSMKVARLSALDGVSDAVRLRGGAADLSWQTVRNPDGRFGTDATFDLRDVAISSKGVHVDGSGHVRFGARTAATLDETVVGKLHVELDGVALETPRGASTGTWLRVGRGKITLDHEDGSVDAELHGRLDDLRPLLAQRANGLTTEVPDLDLTQPLDFDIGLHRRGRELTIDIDELSRPGLDLHGKVHRRGKTTRYAVLLRRARLGIYGEAGHEPTLRPLADEAWRDSTYRWVRGETDMSEPTPSDDGGKVVPAYFD